MGLLFHRLAKWAARGLLTFAVLCSGLPHLIGGEPGVPGNPVIVAYNRDYPPYEHANAKGEPEGFGIDLVKAAARVMGVSIRFQGGMFGDIREDLASGRIHVIASMLKSDERSRSVDFSDPYLVVHYSIFAREGGTPITSLEDLRGRRILVGRGSQMHDHLIALGFAESAVPAASEPDALRRLAAGTGDAALAPHLQGLLLIKQARLSNLRTVGAPVLNRELCFAVAKGHENLRDRLNTGLAILHRTGEYQGIYRKWFGELDPPRTDPKQLLKTMAVVVVPLALVLVGILLWNRTLRRRVAERTRDLKQSQEFLQAIQDALPLMVFAKDAKQGFKFTVWNRVAEEITGIPAKDALGRTDFDFFPPEEAEGYLKADKETLAKGGLVEVCEETLQSRERGTIILRTLKVPVRDEQGEPLYLLGISEDITERKSLEDTLRQTQRLESLGVLAGGIAHDFNNLLTAILGNLELVGDLIEPDHPVQPFLRQAETAVNRAATLARQMLAYSGRGAFLIRRISLNALIQEMANLLQVSIPKKVVTRFELDERLPNVNGDESQLQQVVMNLVTNAAEAIGNQEGTITLSTRQETLGEDAIQALFPCQDLKPGPFVVLQVSDTGCGMDAEVMQKLFEPFFTTKFTGRGLGLAALHGILRGHKGGVRVISEPGKGSSFQIYLPALERQDALDSPPGGTPAPNPGQGTILIVEDDPFVRESTRMGLTLLGYQVLESADGADALEVLRARSADISLVLLDLTMPKLDGREVLREMRGICPGMPVILCSGYNEREALEGVATPSVAGFLPKPYSTRELAAMLEKVLNPAPGSHDGNA